jgi:hypothetical protein
MNTSNNKGDCVMAKNKIKYEINQQNTVHVKRDDDGVIVYIKTAIGSGPPLFLTNEEWLQLQEFMFRCSI